MKENFRTTKQQFKASISLTFNSHYWIEVSDNSNFKRFIIKNIDHLKTHLFCTCRKTQIKTEA